MQTKQGALEYNAYLIRNLLKEGSRMTKTEYETCMDFLYLNLKKLSLNAD